MDFKSERITRVINDIRTLQIQRKEQVTFLSLSNFTPYNGYELFMILCSLYHTGFIDISNKEFYKEPFNIDDFKIWLSPYGFDYFLTLQKV